MDGRNLINAYPQKKSYRQSMDEPPDRLFDAKELVLNMYTYELY